MFKLIEDIMHIDFPIALAHYSSYLFNSFPKTVAQFAIIIKKA